MKTKNNKTEIAMTIAIKIKEKYKDKKFKLVGRDHDERERAGNGFFGRIFTKADFPYTYVYLTRGTCSCVYPAIMINEFIDEYNKAINKIKAH